MYFVSLHSVFNSLFDFLKYLYLQDKWLACQKSWLYLESIFNASDIQRQLPSEDRMFRQVDKSYKDIMRKVQKVPLAMRAATQPGWYKLIFVLLLLFQSLVYLLQLNNIFSYLKNSTSRFCFLHDVSSGTFSGLRHLLY